MSTIPKRMILVKGRIKMADGSSLHAYLKEWQKKTKAKDGAAINMMNHEPFAAYRFEVEMTRELLLSA